MPQDPRVKAAQADSPNFERMVRLVTMAAVGSIFLIAGMGAFAQTSSPDKPTPAQKQPAKPGAQGGEQKMDGSSPQYAPRRPGQPGAPETAAEPAKRDAAAGGTEKTPAKSGAQGGKEPAGK